MRLAELVWAMRLMKAVSSILHVGARETIVIGRIDKTDEPSGVRETNMTNGARGTDEPNRAMKSDTSGRTRVASKPDKIHKTSAVPEEMLTALERPARPMFGLID